MTDDGLCPLCSQVECPDITRMAMATDRMHLFPIGPSNTLRKSLCNTAYLVL